MQAEPLFVQVVADEELSVLKHAVARAQQENAARAGAAAEEIKRLRAQLSQQAAHIRTLRGGQTTADSSQVQIDMPIGC